MSHYSKSLLENMFVLNDLPKVNQVMVWKISGNTEPFQLENYKSGFQQFESSEAYLIFTKTLQWVFQIYYWIGSAATLYVKQDVAKYAVILHENINAFYGYPTTPASIRLSRENEYLESESFCKVLNITGVDCPSKDRSEVYREYNVPTCGPNLYIVRGNLKGTRIKMVPIHIKWMKPDTCLVLETGSGIEELHPVNMYCGPEASNDVHQRTTTFSSAMDHFNCAFRIPSTIRRGSLIFKSLVELLEDTNYNRSVDVDFSNDHLKNADTFVVERDNEVVLYKLSMEYMDGSEMMTRMKLNQRPITEYDFDEYASYIFDSKSIAGIFFLYGEGIQIWQKILAIQHAEEYLHNNAPHLSKLGRMRVMPTNSNQFILDFEINLLNRPTRLESSAEEDDE